MGFQLINQFLKGAIFTALALAIALLQPSYASAMYVDIKSSYETIAPEPDNTHQHCHADCTDLPSSKHSAYLSHEVPSQARLISFRSDPPCHAVNSAEPTVTLSKTIFRLKRPPRA